MARLQVKVKPNARKTRIVSDEDGLLAVDIAAPPENNKANIELVKFLSRHFKKPVRIVSGLTGKKKIVEF